MDAKQRIARRVAQELRDGDIWPDEGSQKAPGPCAIPKSPVPDADGVRDDRT